MSNPTDIRLTPSLAAGLIATLPWAALLAATMVLALNGLALAWLLSPVALLGLIWQGLSSGLLVGRSTVTALELRGDELWAELGHEGRYPARAAADSRLGARLTLLKLALPTTSYSPRTVVLMADGRLPGNVQPEPFRQLRVWLRLHSG